ncbi:FxSxx-COOH system tetratricopeptide repeat protein [Streptomyces sp. NPDC002619]|uniref:FxSxx-COOH system tetratricopeptide repeat protein n=1 Tax=Streptomyces sp. NPDC002619 TaxID=3364655 RepID=UPI00369ECC37
MAPRPEPDPVAGHAVALVHAGADGAWATWIGDLLERCGTTVTYQLWDPGPGASLEEALTDLLPASGSVLLVLSNQFLRLAPYPDEDWTHALRTVLAPDSSRFVLVWTDFALPLLQDARPLAAAGLTGLDAAEAERRLLERLGLPDVPALAEREGDRPRYPASLPEVWGGVPRRNIRFTGRDWLLDEVHRRLRARDGRRVLTLHGMSGVGKTQLALEYAFCFAGEYDVVWWANAGARTTCRRGLAELAPKLGLSTGFEYGQRLRAVHDSLRRGTPFPRWLLVLDSADEPAEIGDLVPPGPGHVLITSRNPEWRDHGSALLDIPVFERRDSVRFIRRRAPRLTEPEADRLADALEDLPLLLDQTAGWLNDSDLSVEEYIALLEGGIGEAVVSVSADFPLAFETAWSILLDRLRSTVPEAVDLLRLCTFFAPGYIPVRLLREMPHDDLPEQLAGLFNDPLLWNRAIDQLRQYSVVRLESHEAAPDEAAPSGESLYLHRMVHQIVRQQVPDDRRREFADVARRALAAADPKRPTDARVWNEYAELVPHLGYADVLTSEDPAVRTLVLNCLRYLWFAGEYAEGVALGERAMATWRSQVHDTDRLIWELTYHYANLLRATGRFQETEAIDRAAVQHLREERGEHDLDHLRTASGLAADLRGLARYDEALALDQRLFPAYRDLFGEEDTRTLNALNNLGFSLRLRGRYEEAKDIDRRTLDARLRLLTRRHPWTLFSEVSYAIDLRLLGRYSEAEAIQEKNAREHRVVLGSDNPGTLRAEHNLALCHYRTGALAKAEPLISRVLELFEYKLGDAHLETVAVAVSRSCFAREHGDLDRARELSESVVVRYEETLIAGHPFTAGAHANHALILGRSSEVDHALTLIEQALAHMTQAVGPNHPWTLGCAVNASALRNLAGDIEGAAALSEDTVNWAAEALGRAHPLTLAARIARAADLRGLHQRGQADKAEREALADLDATLGPQHIHTISARSRNRPYWDFEPQTT